MAKSTEISRRPGLIILYKKAITKEFAWLSTDMCVFEFSQTHPGTLYPTNTPLTPPLCHAPIVGGIQYLRMVKQAERAMALADPSLKTQQ